MPLSDYQRATGVFLDARNADAALEELRTGGFAMDQISVVSRSPQRLQRASHYAQEGISSGALVGGTFGSIAGAVIGFSTLVAFPEIGLLLILTALTTTFSSGVLGATAGGLLGGLIGYGLPRPTYSRSQQPGVVIMVEGTEADIREAEAVFSRWRIQEFRIYDMATEASTQS